MSSKNEDFEDTFSLGGQRLLLLTAVCLKSCSNLSGLIS